MKPSIVALLATIGATASAIVSVEAMSNGQYFLLAVSSFVFGACVMAFLCAATEEIKTNKKQK